VSSLGVGGKGDIIPSLGESHLRQKRYFRSGRWAMAPARRAACPRPAQRAAPAPPRPPSGALPARKAFGWGSDGPRRGCRKVEPHR